MTGSHDDRAREFAYLLGAVQEARRLGCRHVGSEHLLIATLADPTVRRALADVGRDLRDVQDLVTRATRGRALASRVELTSEAAELITRAAAAIPDLVPDRRPDPRLLSDALGALLVTLLRDEGDTAAARILAELDLVEHAPQLIAIVEENVGSHVRPRPE